MPIILVGCVAQFALCATVTSFWPLPMAAVGASTAAGVLAGVTMLGNLTGPIAPYITGLLHDRTHSYVLSFAFLGASIAIAALLVLASRWVGSEQASPGPVMRGLH